MNDDATEGDRQSLQTFLRIKSERPEVVAKIRAITMELLISANLRVDSLAAVCEEAEALEPVRQRNEQTIAVQDDPRPPRP